MIAADSAEGEAPPDRDGPARPRARLGLPQTYEAGDAYYAPPGHTPKLYAGSQVVEFSPSRELQQTMEVVEKNMAAAGA